MNYLSSSKSRAQRKKGVTRIIFWFFVIGIAVFLLIILKPRILDLAGMTNIPFANPALFTDVEELRTENDNLRNELNQNSLDTLIRDFLIEENARLKGYFLEANQAINLAAVSKKPPVSIHGTLIIDQGRVDGVSVGDMVYAYENFAIGSIAVVSDHASKIDLFARAGRETLVSVNENQSIARGIGSGVFEMTLPKGSEITIGDVVRLPLSRLSVLGTVFELDNDPQDPEITVIVKSPINVQHIDYVEIRDGNASQQLVDPSVTDIEENEDGEEQ